MTETEDCLWCGSAPWSSRVFRVIVLDEDGQRPFGDFCSAHCASKGLKHISASIEASKARITERLVERGVLSSDTD